MTTTDFSGVVPPDLARIRSLSRNWRSWQGLYAVFWGVANLVPVPSEFGLLELIALGLGIVAIRRYYKRTLGLVQPDEAKQTKARWIAYTALAALIVGSALLTFYSDGPIPRLPQAAGPLLMASGMVVWWQVTQREHPDILVAAGVALAWAATLALAPPLPHRLAYIVTHVLFSGVLIAHGLRTHFTLMRFVRTMQERAGVGAV
jgi:hypothetical protein